MTGIERNGQFLADFLLRLIGWEPEGAGNVVGSMLFFVTANPGVIALVRPLDVDGAVVSVHLPFFLVTLLLVTVLFWRGDVGRADGVFLLLIYVAYWGANYLL